MINVEQLVKSLYGDIDFSNCPFTEKEVTELERTNELLVYLPKDLTIRQLCNIFKIKTNINFNNEKLIKNIMTDVDQWFIASNNKTPELLYTSARAAQGIYNIEGVYGMDFRRYLAFAATFISKFGIVPDKQYWTFLLSGNYDRSGVSIVGFDCNGILSHHGWMRDFKAKFVGSRYIVMPSRIEITPETEKLERAYRGKSSSNNLEASMD